MHDLTEGTGVSQDDRTEARYVVVHGRVQGVFFRSATRRTAQHHGIAGWVRNLPNGSVEAWLEGAPDAVEAVEAWMTTGGPPSAVVEDVEVEHRTTRGYVDFEVRR